MNIQELLLVFIKILIMMLLNKEIMLGKARIVINNKIKTCKL